MQKIIDFFRSLFGLEPSPPKTEPKPKQLQWKQPITLTINGQSHHLEVAPDRLLVELIRDELGLTGTKQGCESNMCGACTVLLDGQSVHSCTVLAVQADGKTITTIEGIGDQENLHPVQQAFLDNLGYQCGFCTPGMIMSSVGLLTENPDPTAEEIRLGLIGNLCRCTGYLKIIESVRQASKEQ